MPSGVLCCFRSFSFSGGQGRGGVSPPTGRRGCRCRRPSGGCSRRSCPRSPVFAHEVKARTALELEVVLHLVQQQSAAGRLGLLPAAGGQPLEPPALGRGGELRPRRSGQGAGVFGQPGVGPEGAAQLCGQKPQPELRCAAQKPGPPGEEGGQLRLAQGGEEVEGYDGLLRAAARGQQARQLHDADAGESVIGELHLAHFPGKHPAIGAVQQAGAALGPDAGQRLAGAGAL